MSTGKIISIAFPDTFVKYSEVGFQKNILSAFGIGSNGYVKAGHALLLLIENKTGIIQYFDFGRYVTPYGKGRVRSAVTDVELEIPIKAQINEFGKIENIKDILIWLEAHPEKTHAEGRMIASVCDDIDYTKAHEYILSLQNQGSIPYKTFGNVGSNCSRLVTDAIIQSVSVKKIARLLKRNSKFTPSPLGNVQKGANGSPMYSVYKGKLTLYTKWVLKENLTNYFHSADAIESTVVKLPKKVDNKYLLEGIGASAYFELKLIGNTYKILRYTSNLVKDFEGNFNVETPGFDINSDYEFVYDSNCSYCHIQQKEVIYRFDKIV